MKITITFLTILLLGINLNSLIAQDWVARYNGPLGTGYDAARSIAIDGSGNVYVTGYSIVSGTNYDYATIKYNSAGVQQWASRYNGPGNAWDYALSIAIDGSGNVYVTGWSTGSGTSSDYATIKYNSAGVQLWVARYNGPANSNDSAYSIAVDGLGNVYVTGESTGSGTGNDYATVKYNSAGVQQWASIYNGPGNSADQANSIAIDGSGNVYVTGYSTLSGINYDYATVKYNSAGVQQWTSRYNGPGNNIDEANSIAVDGSGNVYVSGESVGNGTLSDYATLKYNSSGIQQWEARYNGLGIGHDIVRSIAIDGSGNVYVTGSSSGGGGGADYGTIKYNSAGVQQWVARYNGGNLDDFAYSVVVDASGNVLVTGSSLVNGTYDYATVKYNSSGVQQWVQRYDGPGNFLDGAWSVAVDGSGNVYVTGGSTGIVTGMDYATVKYQPTIGIQPISNEIPEDFSLSQNYPNPFNPTTKIRFALPKSSFATIVVYDMLGREVETLVNEQLNAGTYEVDWNADKFSSGVYYYKLISSDPSVDRQVYVETKKMILIK